MLKAFFASIILACSLNLIAAECPNACSAHGKCGAYDMCVCYRNWMANDCSERVCQFGLAHVDTPLGDLDASAGALTGPEVTVVTNDAMYPYGTQEQFPAMKDSDGQIVPNSAHFYRECSNKGMCDRSSGNCACFDSYSGSACQRASCPVTNGASCSGHGTCETIKTIASWDNNNIYKLWDEHSTMGCVCDAGYDGPDCSQRVCKSGPDPLYYDDYANIRVSNYTYQIYSKATTTFTGNYSIIFYDAFGEDWETGPIDIDADCDAVTWALEAIPNNVVPDGSVLCYNAMSTPAASGNGGVDKEYIGQPVGFWIKTRFTLVFTKNYGRLDQIDINIRLDGSRPTLYTTETVSTLGWHIYPNGFIGENDDLVPDLCEGVLVKMTAGAAAADYTALDVLTTQNTQQDKLLKKCLGDSDGMASTFLIQDGVASNTDIYGWDYGSKFNPHLVKLIETTDDNMVVGSASVSLNSQQSRDPSVYNYPVTKLCSSRNTYLQRMASWNSGTDWCINPTPAGFYAVMYYSVAGGFRIWTRAATDYATTQTFHIYTTQGTLQLVNDGVVAFTHSDKMVVSEDVSHAHSKLLYLANTTNTYGYQMFKGQIDCETAPKGSYGSLECINKDDYVMFFNNMVADASATKVADAHLTNPVYPNIYKVKKISREEKAWNPLFPVYDPNNEVARHQVVLDYGMNSKFHYAESASYDGYTAAIYKFIPKASYNYVAQCSNHGICDQTNGLCQCFAGYTSDDCSVQNALAK